ncbi:MAG: NADPH:quinone reductase [Chloroflexi bacterium]|nr:NADPH:quinone reductase [Chloroflexota bacterium]
MKAAVYHRRGPAREVLEIVDLLDPTPGPGEVRVRVRVSGVNPTDWKTRSAGPDLPPEGQIPDQDGAGVIDAVGPGVDPGRVGQRVWVYNAAHGRFNGTAAEYTCIPSDQAVPLPDGVGFDQGAGLAIPFITAQHCLFADGPLDGRTVLITGGAGAVGNAAIQLAKRGGARVIATASSPEKERLASEAGADHVVDYRDPAHVDQVRRIAPDGVDRIVDVAIAANLPTDIDVLIGHGTIVSYAIDAPDPTIPVRRLMTANARLEFVLVYNLTPQQMRDAVAGVGEALAAGALRPLPEHHFPLERIADAHEAVERHVLGKVLVDIP